MYEVIRLGNKDVPMSATAATPIYYKTVFQDDVLSKFLDEKAETEWLGKLAYIMAKQGAGADMKSASADDYVAWLDGFDPMDIYGIDESNAFVTLFAKQQKAMVDAKKKSGQPTEK